METAVGLPAGHRLVHVEEIDSTNAEALRRAGTGEQGPLWIWADRQRQGRGRLGRKWVSESGNLYATLLVTMAIEPKVAAGLSIAAALAVLRTCRIHLPTLVRIEVKWPNDVLIDGQKAAGILVESTVEGNAVALAIGCGLNLAHAPSEVRYGATSLAAHGVSMMPAQALAALAARMDEVLRVWDRGAGFAVLKTQWLQHARGLGELVTVKVGEQSVQGYFEGLGDNGSLLLRSSAGVHEFHAGEISFTHIHAGAS